MSERTVKLHKNTYKHLQDKQNAKELNYKINLLTTWSVKDHLQDSEKNMLVHVKPFLILVGVN